MGGYRGGGGGGGFLRWKIFAVSTGLSSLGVSHTSILIGGHTQAKLDRLSGGEKPLSRWPVWYSKSGCKPL